MEMNRRRFMETFGVLGSAIIARHIPGLNLLPGEEIPPAVLEVQLLPADYEKILAELLRECAEKFPGIDLTVGSSLRYMCEIFAMKLCDVINSIVRIWNAASVKTATTEELDKFVKFNGRWGK
jgi:hypothetical protein